MEIQPTLSEMIIGSVKGIIKVGGGTIYTVRW